MSLTRKTDRTMPHEPVQSAAGRALRFLTLSALIAVGVLSLSCSRGKPKLPLPPFEGREHGDYPELVPEGSEDEYRVGVGDEMILHVQRHEEFEGEVKVGPSGKITMPLTLDRVDVAGLTLREAEARIAETIRPYVRLTPRVWLEMKQPDSRFVYVLGAVSLPGKLAIRDEKIFVREALARAGWPLRTAALKRTKLISSTPNRRAERKIDLKALLHEGDLTENYEMKPGDVVWVPRTYVSEFAFLGREFLAPFAVLLGMERTFTDIADIPKDNR